MPDFFEVRRKARMAVHEHLSFRAFRFRPHDAEGWGQDWGRNFGGEGVAVDEVNVRLWSENKNTGQLDNDREWAERSTDTVKIIFLVSDLPHKDDVVCFERGIAYQVDVVEPSEGGVDVVTCCRRVNKQRIHLFYPPGESDGSEVRS